MGRTALIHRSRAASRPARPLAARRPAPVLALPPTLTHMQSSVAMLIATEGLSNGKIAVRLGITESTVKVHVRDVLQELQVANRTQLALAMHGLLKKG